MAKKRISQQKQKHELSGYVSSLGLALFSFAGSYRLKVQPLSYTIGPQGAEIYLPAQDVFEKISPTSPPTGLLFADGSFLVFHERVRFGYRKEADPEPTLFRTAYGYHYQRPADHYYFRYDHHPDKGDPATHPLYHLHSAGWLPGASDLQSVPRHRSCEVSLAEVLGLILISFPTAAND
jgi:hypothetical protein